MSELKNVKSIIFLAQSLNQEHSLYVPFFMRLLAETCCDGRIEVWLHGYLMSRIPPSLGSVIVLGRRTASF